MRRRYLIALSMALLVSPAQAKETAVTQFKIVNLVSNQPGGAKNVDQNLVNAWGLAQGPKKSPIWVSDAGTGLATVYAQGSGKVNSLVVSIPGGAPTGIVYAPSIGFGISEGSKSANSTFILDSLAGEILGWNSSVDPTNAVIAVDNSTAGASYTGLALDPLTKLLFAANSAQKQVEVYTRAWKLKTTFADSSLSGAVPYNVAIINGDVYVTFANFSTGGGNVDVFSEDGTLQQRLIANGKLHEPWGLTIAPSTFGTFADSLLVGNLGDGKINAYNPATGKFLGTLENSHGKPLKIDELWALDAAPEGKLTFSAGPSNYINGLVGLVEPLK